MVPCLLIRMVTCASVLLVFGTTHRSAVSAIQDQVEAANEEENQEMKGTYETKKIRTKRMVRTSNLWPNLTIIYCFEDGIDIYDEDKGRGMMNILTQCSGISWLEKNCTETNAQLASRIGTTIRHKGFIRFVNVHEGFAFVGFRDREVEASLGDNEGTMLHELLHIMNHEHEMKNPLSVAFTTTLWGNIGQYYRSDSRFGLFPASDLKSGELFTLGFDSTSIMRYKKYIVSERGFPIYYDSIPSPSEPSVGSLTWPAKETSLIYDVYGQRCKNPAPVCENEGYPGVYRGICGCVCPSGLDPVSGCKDIKTKPHVSDFGEGQFGLLKPTSGCAKGFHSGSRLQQTGSGNRHSSSFHLSGQFSEDHVRLEFCTKQSASSSMSWPVGFYSILRSGGKCPPGFTFGYIQFDDDTNTNRSNGKQGTLPDGDFGVDTRMYFCSRKDGIISYPISLPTNQEFVLFRFEKGGCQQVDGMSAVPEDFTIKNSGDGSVKFKVVGDVPKHEISSDNPQRISLYYCFYKPVIYDCGGVVHLSSDQTNKTIQSPRYPDTFPQNRECNWVITAPTGSKIRLDFIDFDIGDYKSEECVDSLEIRKYLLVQNGIRYCGKTFDKSIVSIENRIGLTLRTGVKSVVSKGFRAVVTLISAEDFCYNPADKGMSYDGSVTYTADRSSCLPWSAGFHILEKHYDFSPNYADMTGKACRNPGGRFLAPMCITSVQYENITIKYCDVCGFETPHDIYDDCDELIQNNSTYCLDDTDAFTGCYGTCRKMGSLSLPPLSSKVGEIICGTPIMPVNSDSIQGLKKVYRVGDTFHFSCINMNKAGSMMCLTSGRWSLIGDVCVGCPTGFFPHNNYCYKKEPDLYRADDAIKKCRTYNFNGVKDTFIVPVRTFDEWKFVRYLRDEVGSHNDRITWVGFTDANTPNQWKFMDNGELVKYSETSILWSGGSRSGMKEAAWKNKKACAFMRRRRGHNEFKQTKCHKMHGITICRKPMAGCGDANAHCETLFEQNPQICNHRLPLSQECLYTCGLCQTDARNCRLPSPPANVKSKRARWIVTGETVVFECTSGHVLTSGNLIRGCKRDGSLTGITPVCTPINDTSTWVNDYVVQNMKTFSYNGYAFTGPTPQLTIKKEGVISTFVAFCGRKGRLQLQVWRSVNGSETKLMLVGRNNVLCRKNRKMTWKIPEKDRIEVQPGDMLGLYPQFNDGIALYPCKHIPEYKHIHSFITWYGISRNTFKPGQVYQFNNYKSCRIFSLNAKIING